jgi:hypothetical protein
VTRHPSFGATLGVDFAGGTVYDTIGQVRDIEGPGVEREAIQVPFDHDMGAGEMAQFFAGVPVPGQMTFSLNWDPRATIHAGSTSTGIWGSFNAQYNGTTLPRWQYQNGKITGGTATMVFRGFVQSMTPNMGMVQGSVEAEVVVQVSGKPTLTIT